MLGFDIIETCNLTKIPSLPRMNNISKFDNLFKINNRTVIDNKKRTIHFLC